MIGTKGIRRVADGQGWAVIDKVFGENPVAWGTD